MWKQNHMRAWVNTLLVFDSDPNKSIEEDKELG